MRLHAGIWIVLDPVALHFLAVLVIHLGRGGSGISKLQQHAIHKRVSQLELRLLMQPREDLVAPLWMGLEGYYRCPHHFVVVVRPVEHRPHVLERRRLILGGFPLVGRTVVCVDLVAGILILLQHGASGTGARAACLRSLRPGFTGECGEGFPARMTTDSEPDPQAISMASTWKRWRGRGL